MPLNVGGRRRVALKICLFSSYQWISECFLKFYFGAQGLSKYVTVWTTKKKIWYKTSDSHFIIC